MRIIKPSYEIKKLDEDDILIIEEAGRCCYKSEKQIKEGSAEKLIQFLIDHGHESVLEHSRITVKFVVDRGVSHELVRHRLASYSQESTRYCNYGDDKFDHEITVIRPCFLDNSSGAFNTWSRAMVAAEKAYFDMLEQGCTPQEARSVLPNSLKTEVYMTANFREWRHVLELRTAKAAHPQFREVMIPLLKELQTRIPALFYDISFQDIS